MDKIRTGEFDPDKTRSGRFSTKRLKLSSDVNHSSSCQNSLEVIPDENPCSSFSVDREFLLVEPFVNAVDSAPEPPPQLNCPETTNVSSDSESSLSSDSDSSADSEATVPELGDVRRRVAVDVSNLERLDAGAKAFVHVSSRIVHYRESGAVDKIKCGRHLNVSYKAFKPPFDPDSIKSLLLCKQCFHP